MDAIPYDDASGILGGASGLTAEFPLPEDPLWPGDRSSHLPAAPTLGGSVTAGVSVTHGVGGAAAPAQEPLYKDASMTLDASGRAGAPWKPRFLKIPLEHRCIELVESNFDRCLLQCRRPGAVGRRSGAQVGVR